MPNSEFEKNRNIIDWTRVRGAEHKKWEDYLSELPKRPFTERLLAHWDLIPSITLIAGGIIGLFLIGDYPEAGTRVLQATGAATVILFFGGKVAKFLYDTQVDIFHPHL